MELTEWLGASNILGQNIWKNKYCNDNETFNEWLNRVSSNNMEIKKLITEKKFLFGGRILANRGLQHLNKNISYSNCYVISAPTDSMKDIMRCASDMAETYKIGGGCGIHLNNLRPRGTDVNNNAKTSTGPICFMDLYSTVTGVVAQNGRRGALMIALEVSHPDIEEFINIKQDLTKVEKANTSIMITDEFMNCVKNDSEYQLYFKTEKGQETKKTVKAREIMQKIAFSAWDMGEPGMVFWDRVNNWNLMQGIREFILECTNPCLTKETLVYVADGRGNVSIGDLAKEGKDVDVFCYNNNNKVVIRKMRNPRVTGHNEAIYKVNIDGGHSIRCTGNHKFLLNDGTYKEAKDLIKGDSLDIIRLTSENIKDYFKDDLYDAQIFEQNTIAKKKCEVCNKEFEVAYNRREIGICTNPECISTYTKSKNKLNNFVSLYSYKVVSIEIDGYEDVYNGTVDKYHNFFVGGFQEAENNNRNEYVYLNNLQCGELPLPPNSSCLLGSINFSEYVLDPFTDNARFDEASFICDVQTYVKALNDCLDESIDLHALQAQKDAARYYRAIGLGIMGLANTAIKLRLEYGSGEFIKFIDKIGFMLIDTALMQSALLAKEHGKAPILKNYKNLTLTSNPFIKANTTVSTRKLISKYGLYNSQLLTTAPTGSISTMINTSGGAEPLYDVSYNRTTQSLHDKEVSYSVNEKIIEQYLELHKTKTIPAWIKKSTAMNLDYSKRILVQATLQKHIDNAISSTINLPESTTVEDIMNVYILSWEAGLKGVTVFRRNCRRIGILNSKSTAKTEDISKKEKEEKEDDSSLKWGDILKSSDDLIGFKKKLNTGCGSLHVQAFFDKQGNFREIYLSKGSTGGCNSFMVGLSRMISLAARAGISLDKIVDQLHSTIVCPSYIKRAYTSAGTSCPNALGHALVEIKEQAKSHFTGEVVKVKKQKKIEHIEESKDNKENILKCPKCGASMFIQEGCITCKMCGESKCS